MKRNTKGPSVLNDDQIYIGDNGRVLCGKHSGAMARATGRDISGQPVMRAALESIRKYKLRCEKCS